MGIKVQDMDTERYWVSTCNMVLFIMLLLWSNVPTVQITCSQRIAAILLISSIVWRSPPMCYDVK